MGGLQAHRCRPQRPTAPHLADPHEGDAVRLLNHPGGDGLVHRCHHRVHPAAQQLGGVQHRVAERGPVAKHHPVPGPAEAGDERERLQHAHFARAAAVWHRGGGAARPRRVTKETGNGSETGARGRRGPAAAAGGGGAGGGAARARARGDVGAWCGTP